MMRLASFLLVGEIVVVGLGRLGIAIAGLVGVRLWFVLVGRLLVLVGMSVVGCLVWLCGCRDRMLKRLVFMLTG
jgi:hypothetical protein